MAVSVSPRKIPAPIAAVLSICLAVVFLPFLALPASAVGGFEDSDGNMVVNNVGGTDWANAPGVVRVDDTNCADGKDTGFPGSNKNDDDPLTVGCANVPPNKNDLKRAYGSTSTVGDDRFIHLAYALVSKTGSAHVDFEFNQSPNLQPNGVLKARTVGDILISYDWNGSSQIDINRRTWGGSVWGAAVPLTGSAASAGVNDVPTQTPGQTITDPIAGGTYPVGTFGEVGINATQAGFFPEGVCRTFGSAYPKTRTSGSSFNSELADYISPININLSNCSKIVIKKQNAAGEPLAGALFTVSGNGITPLTCTTDATGTCAIDGLFPKATAYTVTETTAPPGYLNDSSPQQVLINEADKTYNVTFTNGLGGLTWEKRDAGTGAKIGGATFVLTATGGDAKTLGFGPLTVVDNGVNDEDADNGEFAVSDLFTGAYSLAETVAPTGYELSSPNPKTFTISDATPTKAFIGTTTNTGTSGSFQNPRKTSSLTVKKFNADKSLALQGANFTLYRDSNGTAGLQQASDAVAGTCTTSAAGTCTISGLIWGSYYWVETDPPAGYNFSDVTVQGPIEISAENAGTTFPETEFTNLKSKIVTEATDANLPGGTITDTATLSGVPTNAAGTITFRAYSDDTCSTLAYTSPTQAVSGPGTYGGANAFTYAPTQAGSYYWIASYSGDVTNKVQPVAGKCGDDGETSVVRPAKPGIQTQVSDESIQLPAGSVTDKATIQPVTGNATGTVDFAVYANDTCTGATAFTSSNRPITVKGSPGSYFAEATSEAFIPTNAGTYYWVATFSGDVNNESVAGKCKDAGETVVVDKAQPSIATQVSDASIALPAGSVSDTATVSGVVAATPQGTVDFAVYANDTCTGTPVFTSNDRALSGAGSTKTATSASFTPTNAGTYYWVATFSGDVNNESVAGKCKDAGETVVVDKAQPSIATQVSDASIALPAGSVSDTATVSGVVAATPQGTVDFAVYANDTCTGTPVFTSNDRALSGAGSTKTATSASFTPTNAGTYYWVATFSGDVNNESVAGKCKDAGETVVVDKAQPSIATQVSDASIALPAGSVSDTATVSGVVAATPQGTVDFAVYANDTCTGTPVFTSNDRALSGAGSTKTATSASFTPTNAGTYYWVATFSGDVNNESVAGKCKDAGETVVVGKNLPSIATSVDDATIQLPQGSVSDTATLSGLVASDTYGTVDFLVYGPKDATCQGEPVFFSLDRQLTVEGASGTATSEVFEPTLAGDYHWIAFYEGDANNVPVEGACGDTGENVTVDKATNAIATSAVASAALPTGTISDSATITGLNPDPQAGGSVDFALYGINDTECSGTPVFTSTDRPITVNAQDPTKATASSASYTPKLAGVYRWIADYSGDDNNSGAKGVCNEEGEISTIDVAPTDIETDATDSATLPNGSLQDTATVTGLTTDPAATGTIGFELYGPFAASDEPDCTGTPIFTSSKNLDGSGATSDSFTPKEAGTYYWIAEYSGDANNAGSRGACGEPTEISTVNKARTDVSTTATPQAILGSDSLTDIRDAAVVTGATIDPAATGTVTFDLYGPYTGDAAQDCEGAPLFTSVDELSSGDGGYAAESGAYTPTAAGTYLWIARYSGDDNNEASAGECGEAGEISVVNEPELSKVANLEVQAPGGEIEYTVTATNIGDLPIKDGVIVDTLPEFVTPKIDSISNGGQAVETDGIWTITWTIDIEANSSVPLTYTVTVDEDVPESYELINTATFFNLERTETVTTPLVRDVEFLAGECLNNAPFLSYTVEDAAPGELVTITFVNPDGDDVVISGLPLSGKVLWPGSVVDADGNPTDWPGWRLEDGVWVEGDEFDWVRPTVTVIVETDGDELATAAVARLAAFSRQVVVSAGAVISYPDATPVCDSPPPGTTEEEEPVEPEVLGTKLPATGAGQIPALAGFALMMLTAGVVAVVATRRKGQEIL